MLLNRICRHVFDACAAAQPGSQARGFAQLALANHGIRKGPEGRHAISGVTVTVFGSTGFLGRYVVNAFARGGSRTVLPFRADDIDMQHLRPMGDLGQIVELPDFSIRDDDMIRHAISKSNIVINLIGAVRETWNYSFKEVHADFPEKLARMCAETASVERLVHFSCLGASHSATSQRLQTKALGDEAVMSAFPSATIFKPGPLVGLEDKYFNMFALMAKGSAFIPLYDGGLNLVQPVYVRDVIEALMKSLEVKDTCGKTYHLGGPKAYRVKDLVNLIYDTIREERSAWVMPAFAAKGITVPRDYLAKRLPLHVFTTDYYYTTDFVNEQLMDCTAPADGLTFADLGISPRIVTEGMPIDHIRYYRAGGYDAGAMISEGDDLAIVHQASGTGGQYQAGGGKI